MTPIVVVKASLVVASIVAKYSDIGEPPFVSSICMCICARMCVSEWCCVLVATPVALLLLLHGMYGTKI